MPSPHDLTTLAALKTWLGVASGGDDDLLAGLITDISLAIAADLGRSVTPTVYTETRDGSGERSIVLRQWPVTEILTFTIDDRPASFAATPAAYGSQVFAAILDIGDPGPPGCMQRLSLRSGVMPHGIQNVAITYRAGYEIAGENAVIPTTAPYLVTAAAPYGAWQSDGAVMDVTGRPLIAGPVPAAGLYTVANGVYTFAAVNAGTAVVLRYGYIPADLARACCEWAADRYAARQRIGQSAKTLGGQETTSFIVKAMPDVVSRLLQPYRRVVGP
ncbi:hypothetical protein [Beijerinckia sp. L45]|uniref:hypothetical protein n=1 Tax=Beijerinckia sp. L45 TaxID=1641855 RepID=UPI00131D7C78|nr:hypothetical protein [Beijerinckia sp. L45]